MSAVELISKYGYCGPDQSLKESADYLKNYGSGSVNLSKNDETGIAHIQFQQEGKENVLSGKMMVDFYNIVEELGQWKEGRGVILSGYGETFCAGADLVDIVQQISDPEGGFKLSRLMNYTLNKLKYLPMISVCFIHGTGAVGGATEIATACDYRLMSSEGDPRIQFIHLQRGYSPLWGGLPRLVNLVGENVALDLFLTARRVDKEEAMKIGLVQGEIDSVEATEKWLQEKTKFGPVAMPAVKHILKANSESYDKLSELEARLFSAAYYFTNNVMTSRST